MKLLGVPREVAKPVYLSLVNGGRADYDALPHKPKFIQKFKKEMTDIHQRFSLLYPKEFEERKAHNLIVKGISYNNNEASYVNTLLCDFENKILQCMHTFFGSPVNCVLCFDGIMLRKGTYNTNLRDCEAYIKKELNIEIALKEKEMDEGFTKTPSGGVFDMIGRCDVDEMEEARDPVIDYTRIRQQYIRGDAVSNHVIANLFHALFQHDVKTYNSEGDGYVWDEKRRVWANMDACEIMMLIRREKDSVLTFIKDALTRLKNKDSDKLSKEELLTLSFRIDVVEKGYMAVQNTSFVRNTYAMARGQFRDNNFRERIINRQHDLFPIRGGKVIDLQNGRVRDRIKTDYFSFESGVDYIPRGEWTEKDETVLNAFIRPIFMDDQEYIDYIQIKGGSYLSGQCTRDIDINHGIGKNAKSTFLNAFKLVMGEFAEVVSKNIIIKDPNSHSKGQKNSHTSHLLPLEGKRLLITEELEETDVLDDGILKLIASCDPIGGVRGCYEKKTRTINLFCHLLISTNFLAKHNPNDQAMLDRLNLLPFNARFLTKTEMEIEKTKPSYDEKKHHYCVGDVNIKEQHSKMGRPLDIFFSWLVEGAIKFYMNRNDGIQKPSIVSNYCDSKFEESDVVGIFLKEECVVVDRKEWVQMDKKTQDKNKISVQDWWDRFIDWAKENDMLKGQRKSAVIKQMVSMFDKVRDNRGSFYERVSIKKEHESLLRPPREEEAEEAEVEEVEVKEEVKEVVKEVDCPYSSDSDISIKNDEIRAYEKYIEKDVDSEEERMKRRARKNRSMAVRAQGESTSTGVLICDGFELDY